MPHPLVNSNSVVLILCGFLHNPVVGGPDVSVSLLHWMPPAWDSSRPGWGILTHCPEHHASHLPVAFTQFRASYFLNRELN